MYGAVARRQRDSVFYALSLLGTVRPGDTGFRRQALAASIAEASSRQNPKHPGAAHFIIHSFDDPDHAPLGLTPANAYAKIAPSAAHALHMPSHIFVQLGMWQEAVASNVDAYKAAVDLNARMKLAEGREDFHTLSWLRLRQPDARQVRRGEEERRAGEGGGGSQPRQRRHSRRLSRHAGAAHLRHRPVGEAELLAAAGAARRGDHAAMPGMPGMGGGDTARPPGPTSSASAPRRSATWRRPKPPRRS